MLMGYVFSLRDEKSGPRNRIPCAPYARWMNPALCAVRAADDAPPAGVSAASRSDPRLDRAMERYVSGDLAAFDELYTLVAPSLHRYLVQLVRQRELADDLLQHTFLKVHLARGSWISGSHAYPFFLAVARNAALDELRRRSTRSVRLTETGTLPEVAEPPPSPALAPDAAETVRGAIYRLPARYREAIELTKHQNLSLREAALVAGATESAMKLRVHRAYRLLRKRLARLAEAIEDVA
jgi:RNA polymerase sigma-70 factor (ECF subfamily)